LLRSSSSRARGRSWPERFAVPSSHSSTSTDPGPAVSPASAGLIPSTSATACSRQAQDVGRRCARGACPFAGRMRAQGAMGGHRSGGSFL
jgi:hypothetical protein